MRRPKMNGHRVDERCNAETHLRPCGNKQSVGGKTQLPRQWHPLHREPKRSHARQRSDREGAVVKLNGWDRLEEIAVQGPQLHIPFGDDTALHEREGVVAVPRLHASNKGAGDGSQADQHCQQPYTPLQRAQRGDGSVDARLKETDAGVEADGVDGEGAREVCGKSVRRHARDAAFNLIDSLLLEARLDHPPADQTLRASEHKEPS
mmetsp:Transcript_60057/g.137686  ORF Transcript_60057/g.137686 Transcript_60057/m.137686 type:complete len:206 (-) Transcript_60057:628-1245(-)